MKKLLQSLFVLMLFVSTAMAQNRTVTGTVTSKEDGLPLPGVSVKVKEAPGIGMQTNPQGKFSLNVPSDAKTLVFTYLGHITKEVVITGNVINVILEGDSKVLSEVVIEGAYGTKSTNRTSSVNAQAVSGDDLNTVRGTNVNNALAGKVSGIQVRSQSAAAIGRNTEVRLRGAGGFGSGSGALYVVDGTILPNADDLNLDDVENVSVLQGPAAAALFGTQAANGAIVISTKKGKKSAGSGITVNLGATFENVYVLPEYQNTYAGGSSQNMYKYTWNANQPAEWKALDGKFYHGYNDDASWGPKIEGQEYIPWYAWYPGTDYSYKTTTLTAQPNNIRDFFNTGVALNNTVSFSDGGDNYNIKVTYGNQYTQGLIPNSSLELNLEYIGGGR